MDIHEFDYDLPESYIAQEPVEPRDASRLMVIDRKQRTIEHRTFRDIGDYLNDKDVIVMNNSRVIPARLPAHRVDTGGKMEILLLRQLDDRTWRVLVGGKKAKRDTRIGFEGQTIQAVVIEEHAESERTIRFDEPVDNLLEAVGQMPLPPYIYKPITDAERYQTVYSRHEGSAAAPTAGLHMTPELLINLRERGIQLAYCMLHIGLDTFQPVRVQDIRQHHIHSEWASLSAGDARTINEAKLSGGRVIALGTTSARTLETAAILSAGGEPSNPAAVDNVCAWRPVVAFERDTDLFIYPGYRWRVVDALITNFHLPKSTLLMMIASFMGKEFALEAYETAKSMNYRFFSFGDAMLIL